MSNQDQINSKPVLSVIVITKNNYNGLLTTLNSFNISEDLRKMIQVVLINGGNDQETVSLIKDHLKNDDIAISEDDEGIYDAMNKGVRNASGEWSIFINAGDTFGGQDVIEKLIEYLDPEFDILYGDCILNYPGFKILKKASNPENLWKGMITSHQSFIIKTNILKQNLYNLKYSLGADFNLLICLYNHGKEFKYLPFAISQVDTTGISNRKMIKSICQHYQSLRDYKLLSCGRRLYYLTKYFFLVGINIFRLLLPGNIYLSIVKRINKQNIIID